MFCREMDSDNHQTPPAFPLRVLYSFQPIGIRLPDDSSISDVDDGVGIRKYDWSFQCFEGGGSRRFHLPQPLPPPSIRGQERSAGSTKRGPPQQSLRSRPHVRVNYDDADAPKDEAAVDVTYSEDLGDLVAPPPKKKKKKKNTKVRGIGH